MLFLKLEQYGFDFAIFGDEKRSSFNDLSLNEGYRVQYQSFEKLPKMYGGSFESFELLGKKLVGYVLCPYWALSDDPVPDGSSMPELVIYYVNKKVTTDFREWLRCNPLIRSRRGRRYIGLFRTYEGEWVLYFLENGILQYLPITETSFISNGHVTTLAETIEKNEAHYEEQLKQAKDWRAKVEKDPFNIVTLINRSNALRFVRNH